MICGGNRLPRPIGDRSHTHSTEEIKITILELVDTDPSDQYPPAEGNVQ
jgi:hypothetical protein